MSRAVPLTTILGLALLAVAGAFLVAQRFSDRTPLPPAQAALPDAALALDAALVVPTPLAIATPAPAIPTPAEGTPTPSPAAEAEPAVTPTTVAEPALPVPAPGAKLSRLIVPKARIDHALSARGLNARREMEDPATKDEVAWYTFSTLPGYGSNAVFSGHVDWYTGERGVFWFLRSLTVGDEAEVHYSDGMVLRYRVVRVEVHDAEGAPIAEITAPAAIDQLTMITCDGTFQRSRQDYTQRRIVVAERVG